MINKRADVGLFERNRYFKKEESGFDRGRVYCPLNFSTSEMRAT